MTKRLIHLPAWRQARRIGLFIAADGEISPGEILHWAWRRRVETYLPVLTRGTSPRMHFYRYRPNDPLQPNHYGIPEPAPRPRCQADPRFLDVVLTPLVAFDGAGARLGMGGGFYDRSFAFLRHRARWKHPKLIGIAYDFQRVEALPVQPWDVMLDGVVTDHAVYGTLADTARYK